MQRKMVFSSWQLRRKLSSLLMTYFMRLVSSNTVICELCKCDSVIRVCLIKEKVMALMTIAFSPNYLLARVDECDDYIFSYHILLYCSPCVYLCYSLYYSRLYYEEFSYNRPSYKKHFVGFPLSVLVFFVTLTHMETLLHKPMMYHS